jgi:hypothetical protein
MRVASVRTTDKIVTKTGWGRDELYQYFSKLDLCVGCEVGVFRGRNAELLFNHIPGLKLYLVEPYSDHSFRRPRKLPAFHSENREAAEKRLNGLDAEWIIGFSEDVAGSIEDLSLDFVYIDGDHQYDFVMLDLILWSRKVRAGGVISGHDFRMYSVKQAVKDYTNHNKIGSVYVTDKKKRPHTTDRLPSWYFIKEGE